MTEVIPSSPAKGVYNPKTFILHAALLDQGFPHCPKFPTAASRRSGARVSVPLWPVALSGRLSVVALVGHYPTNKLIERKLIFKRITPFINQQKHRLIVWGISSPFGKLFPS